MKLEGGSLNANDTSLTVSNANAATIYISIATNFNNYNDISGDENKRAADYLNKAYPKSYATILPAHIAAYQKYFNRVKLDLGTTDATKLPTDERLKNFNSTNDPQFVTLYYQYGRYLLKVRDNGIGFDVAYRDKIFEIFNRLHASGYEGTGIGLALVRKAVQRMEGEVWAESTPGAGATFSVSLKLADTTETATAPKSRNSTVWMVLTHAVPRIPPRKT